MTTRDPDKAAWIETTFIVDDNRTEWRVLIDGEVQRIGEVPEDVSGSRAYDAALAWIGEQKVAVAGWKHALDRAMNLEEPARGRTTTSKSAPIRLYGWAICKTGTREPVVVTPQQMSELEGGTLPCPVCGEPCGATLEPTREVEKIALAWKGARWRENVG